MFVLLRKNKNVIGIGLSGSNIILSEIQVKLFKYIV